MYLPVEFKEAGPDELLRLPIYLKYSLRCTTSCMRSVEAVTQFMNIPTGVVQILEFLVHVQDEEVLANASKIMRICLRDDKVSHFANDISVLRPYH